MNIESISKRIEALNKMKKTFDQVFDFCQKLAEKNQALLKENSKLRTQLKKCLCNNKQKESL
jgi:hypothetical protein